MTEFIALTDKEKREGAVDLAYMEATKEDEFRKKINAEEKKAIETRKPYCRACCLRDYKDAEKAWTNWKREKMNNKFYLLAEPKNDTDPKSYGEKYFTKVKESLIAKKAVRDGMVVTVPVKFVDFRCERGHGYSVEIEEDWRAGKK